MKSATKILQGLNRQLPPCSNAPQDVRLHLTKDNTKKPWVLEYSQ